MKHHTNHTQTHNKNTLFLCHQDTPINKEKALLLIQHTLLQTCIAVNRKKAGTHLYFLSYTVIEWEASHWMFVCLLMLTVDVMSPG